MFLVDKLVFVTETSDSGITLIEHVTCEIGKKRGQKAFWNVYRLVVFLKAITYDSNMIEIVALLIWKILHIHFLYTLINSNDFLLNYVQYQLSI